MNEGLAFVICNMEIRSEDGAGEFPREGKKRTGSNWRPNSCGLWAADPALFGLPAKPAGLNYYGSTRVKILRWPRSKHETSSLGQTTNQPITRVQLGSAWEFPKSQSAHWSIFRLGFLLVFSIPSTAPDLSTHSSINCSPPWLWFYLCRSFRGNNFVLQLFCLSSLCDCLR